MNNMRIINRNKFSLVELAATVAVLSILVVASFEFYSSTQNVWQISENNRNSIEDARIALDIISRDLANAYYGDGAAPFWHWRPDDPATSGWGEYSNELVAFVSNTPNPPNDDCAKLCEVKYQLHYSSSHDADEGWLERSVTGDRDDNNALNSKWNFFNNLTVSFDTTTSAFTADTGSSDAYQKLVPYVTEFAVDCYSSDNADTEIAPDQNLSGNVPTQFPYYVVITLKLMDQNSWQKWMTLAGSAADSFKDDHVQTFTRTVLIGDRGQP